MYPYLVAYFDNCFIESCVIAPVGVPLDVLFHIGRAAADGLCNPESIVVALAIWVQYHGGKRHAQARTHEVNG